MADDKTNRHRPDRSQINMHEDYEVKYWSKHLGVSREELQRVIDKVGNPLQRCARSWGKGQPSHFGAVILSPDGAR